jgi:plasmid stabilization system protein ParE
MSRSLRLTRRAEASLTEIARWTLARFGPRQAEAYEAELLARCEALLAGRLQGRPCAALLPGGGSGAADLRYLRAGGHFLVYLDRPDALIVIEILHAQSDLPRHLAALGQTAEPE